MEKQEIINIMVESVNNDNRKFSEQIGMDQAQIEQSISQSSPAITFMMENVYNLLKEKNIII